MGLLADLFMVPTCSFHARFFQLGVPPPKPALLKILDNDNHPAKELTDS